MAEEWLGKCIGLHNLGKYDEAIKCYDQVIERNPKHVDAWEHKGFSLYWFGKYDEAIKCYDKAIEIKPDYHTPWNNKGLALNELRKYGEAIRCFDKAIEINPSFAQAWNNRGLALKNLGKYNEAIKCYDTAIEMSRNYVYAWNNKGLALNDISKYDEAFKCFDKAIEINPKFTDTWQNKGNSLYVIGKYDEAIKCFDKAIEIKPKLADAWRNKGRSLNNIGNYNEAIKCFDKAIEINPEDAYTWEGKGLALNNSMKYDEAIGCYDKAIEINPTFEDALQGKGNALYYLKKYDEAIKCYDKAIEINPEHYYSWNSKGGALYRLEKYNEAMQCYDKAIMIEPNNVEPWNNKGLVLRNYGKYGEAIKCYDKVLGLDPQNAVALKGKKLCFSNMNQSEDIRKDNIGNNPIKSFFSNGLKPQDSNIDVTSAIGYMGAIIHYKVKIENCTKKPIAKIRVYPHVPDVFRLKETEKSIDLIESGSSQTVTFEIRPTGECGQCNISGRVNYYDMVSGKYPDVELDVKPLSIICPMLQRKEINEEAWIELVSGLAKAEEIPSVISIGGEGLFGMITEILKGRNLFALSPFIDKSQPIFYGNGKFYGEGIKGLKYAAQIEVQGGAKKSKLIFTAWAQKEDALTGFYHSILEQIEKRIQVKDIEDEIIQQNIQNIHYGDRIGNKFEGDIVAVRSNIGIAAQKCPNCKREAKENEKFCPECGVRVN